MAPHCDSMDGPVVTAARKALESADVNVVSSVKKDGEEEVTRAFEPAEKARRCGPDAQGSG